MDSDTRKLSLVSCRLLRIREVMQICGFSRTALYKSMKTDEFPAPVKLSARSVAWLQDEVIAWVDARVKRRDAKPRRQ